MHLLYKLYINYQNAQYKLLTLNKSKAIKVTHPTFLFSLNQEICSNVKISEKL